MLGPQKFGWATRLLSVVAQVATAVLKLVYIPVVLVENFKNRSKAVLCV